MSFDCTNYYVTDRKGSKDEPVDGDGQKPAVSVARQKYYGPFRNEKLTYGKYTMNGNGEPLLERITGCAELPLDASTDVLVFVHEFNSPFARYTKVVAELAEAIRGNHDSEGNAEAEGNGEAKNNSPDRRNNSDCRKLVSILYS